MASKILIAEDDNDIHYVYRRWLKDKYEVIKAYNGQEAVENYKKHHPDLTLMDIKMPVMPGDEAIIHIFEHDPEAIIVAITAYGSEENELGVPVLRKGFEKNTFMEVIESGLGGRPAIPAEGYV